MLTVLPAKFLKIYSDMASQDSHIPYSQHLYLGLEQHRAYRVHRSVRILALAEFYHRNRGRDRSAHIGIDIVCIFTEKIYG